MIDRLDWCFYSIILFVGVSCTSNVDLSGDLKSAYDEIKFKPDYNLHIRPIGVFSAMVLIVKAVKRIWTSVTEKKPPLHYH
jgi:hypothetical protein